MTAPTYERLLFPGSQEFLAVDFLPPAKAERPTIVYLHGLGSRQSGEKAEYFRSRATESGVGFCSFDFRGHGESSGVMTDVTLSRCLEDLTQVIDWLESEGRSNSEEKASFRLVGSSFGALTALWWARSRPERASAAAHIAPAIGVAAQLADYLGEDGLAEWKATDRLVVADDVGPLELGYGFFEDFSNYPLDTLAVGYAVPTLLLHGALDDRVRWRDVAEFCAGCRACELHLFGDGDHRLLGSKERLWQLATEFFERTAD